MTRRGGDPFLTLSYIPFIALCPAGLKDLDAIEEAEAFQQYLDDTTHPDRR